MVLLKNNLSHEFGILLFSSFSIMFSSCQTEKKHLLKQLDKAYASMEKELKNTVTMHQQQQTYGVYTGLIEVPRNKRKLLWLIKVSGGDTHVMQLQQS